MLGYAHPDIWLDEITSAQLSEWERMNDIKPFGLFRVEFMLAQVLDMMFQLAQSIHGKKGKKLGTRPADFMPWDKKWLRAPKKPRQTTEQMKAVLLGMVKRGKEKV